MKRGQLFAFFSVINTDENVAETFGLFEGWFLSPARALSHFRLDFSLVIYAGESNRPCGGRHELRLDPVLDHPVRLLHVHIPREDQILHSNHPAQLAGQVYIPRYPHGDA